MGLRWAYTIVTTAAVLVVGLVVGGGHDFPAEDLVEGLPGQPKVQFRQYAGYVDVDSKHGKSLFYYFVEANENPDKKPLTLWFNGGPGCSSVGGGGFTELGPFSTRGDGRGLIINSKSWNKVSNLLFVESPAGVGWSYSNKSSDYHTGDKATAKDMFNFMFGWYDKFPTFRNRDLFLAGESYAGHYIPQLAVRLLYHNAHSPDPFNLKGIALGNPLLKVDRDVPAMYDYMWSHGLISDEIKLKITKECDFSVYSFSGSDNVTQYPCFDTLDEAYKSAGDYIDVYGVVYDSCYPSIVDQELRLQKMVTKMSFGVDVCKMQETSFYLNLPEVQKALHANRTNLPYNWSDCSTNVEYKTTDEDKDIVPLLKKILKNHIRLWIYSGDQDSVVPLAGSRTIARELAHGLKFNISVPYGAWFHKGQVAGWQTEYGNMLTFATVRGAAHMVPYSQPSRALHLFSTFIRGRRLPNTTRYYR
ncbi:serine carboxypeptidase-like 42 [Phtheirospermum japonicum]|uniref:Carboxypeptidase n=1 Tax=Phtheirospermum japonicum TaxID=374723 RepID=A0A830AZU5_9LAMI|nr:serine carboxypeptidase-like 42 [Phtheirospermum japonicum]